MKVFTHIEIIILLILVLLVIFFAIIAGYFLKKRKAKRQAVLDQESEIQNNIREKRKIHERKAQETKATQPQKASTPAPKPKPQPQVKPEPVIVYGAHVPEDSMLRRHFITHLKSIIVSLTGPRPTDSALSRHYDTQIASELVTSLQDAAYARRLVINHEEQFRKLVKKDIPQPASIDAQLKAELALEEESVKQAEPATKPEEASGNHIPQDSTLRRHYIQHLRSMIASQIKSTEKNFDAKVETELGKCLQNEAHATRVIQDYEASRHS